MRRREKRGAGQRPMQGEKLRTGPRRSNETMGSETVRNITLDGYFKSTAAMLDCRHYMNAQEDVDFPVIKTSCDPAFREPLENEPSEHEKEFLRHDAQDDAWKAHWWAARSKSAHVNGRFIGEKMNH